MAGFDLKSFFSKPKEVTRVNNVEPDELGSLLEGIPDGLIVYDPDFKVLRFNAVAERLFNLPAASVVGHVLSPRDAADPALQVLAQTIFSSLAPRVVQISPEGERPEVYDLSFTDPVLELRVTTISPLDSTIARA